MRGKVSHYASPQGTQGCPTEFPPRDSQHHAIVAVEHGAPSVPATGGDLTSED